MPTLIDPWPHRRTPHKQEFTEFMARTKRDLLIAKQKQHQAAERALRAERRRNSPLVPMPQPALAAGSMVDSETCRFGPAILTEVDRDDMSTKEIEAWKSEAGTVCRYSKSSKCSWHLLISAPYCASKSAYRVHSLNKCNKALHFLNAEVDHYSQHGDGKADPKCVQCQDFKTYSKYHKRVREYNVRLEGHRARVVEEQRKRQRAAAQEKDRDDEEGALPEDLREIPADVIIEWEELD